MVCINKKSGSESQRSTSAFCSKLSVRLLLLSWLQGETFLEGCIVENKSELVISFGSLTLATATAESDFNATNFNCLGSDSWLASEWAVLLDELTGSYQLVVSLVGEFSGVFLESTRASATAEIDLTALVINGFGLVDCFTRYNALKFNLFCLFISSLN